MLVRKPERKSLFGRPRLRWEENIKKDLQEIECEGLDWLDLAQDKERLGTLLGTVMNSLSPYNAEKLLNS